jgi:hypothetical protein
MHVGEILAQLNCLGITLMAKGDKLCLQPGSQVPSVLITTLRQHKAEILAYLRRASTAAFCARSLFQV